MAQGLPQLDPTFRTALAPVVNTIAHHHPTEFTHFARDRHTLDRTVQHLPRQHVWNRIDPRVNPDAYHSIKEWIANDRERAPQVPAAREGRKVNFH